MNLIKIISPLVEKPNLRDYDEAYGNFSWENVEKDFSWYETGKVNMAYEAIDRHTETDRKDKVALYYSDQDRDERYSFEEMKSFIESIWQCTS